MWVWIGHTLGATLRHMPPPSRIGTDMRSRSAVEVARDISQRYFGPVARWQLLDVGIHRSQVRRWVIGQRMFPRYPGIYAWGRPELTEKGELSAGLLYAGRGAALGGLSALWWQELLGDRPALVHIDAPGRATSRQDLHIRHPRAIDRRFHQDLPVTDLASALLAASPHLETRSLRLCLSRADFHDLLHLPSLQAACACGPPGSRALRTAMAIHLPQLARCTNDLEIDFVLLCESQGLEIPEPNEPKGRFRPDMTWESRRLIVELDGKGAHSSAAQRSADASRQEWLESQGYTVLRFTWFEVNFRREYVAARVRDALA